MASDVPRWDAGFFHSEVKPYECGAWVDYVDHIAAIDEKDIEIEALKVLVRRFQTAASQAKAALDEALEGK